MGFQGEAEIETLRSWFTQLTQPKATSQTEARTFSVPSWECGGGNDLTSYLFIKIKPSESGYVLDLAWSTHSKDHGPTEKNTWALREGKSMVGVLGEGTLWENWVCNCHPASQPAISHSVTYSWCISFVPGEVAGSNSRPCSSLTDLIARDSLKRLGIQRGHFTLGELPRNRARTFCQRASPQQTINCFNLS